MRTYTFTPDAGGQTITITALDKIAFYTQLGDQLGRSGQAIRASSVGPDVWDHDTYLGNVVSTPVAQAGTVNIRIGQVYRPTSGPAIAVAIVDYAGPGVYVVRNASGSGGTRTMSDHDLASYTYDPDAFAY